MTNFWDFSAWGFFNLIAVLMVALMAAHMLKRSLPWLQAPRQASTVPPRQR